VTASPQGNELIRRVGFVGLGNMGGPMCGHLVRAGFEVTAYDLDRVAVRRAHQLGASPASSVSECAMSAQALITVLPGPPQVESVLLGESRGLEALVPGALLIDMSTSSRALGLRILGAAAERDVAVLDAPVAGQSIGALAGTLAIYVGGERDDLERAQRLFEAVGDPGRIHHVGGHGAGYTVKLLLNLLWFIQSVATGEVLGTGLRAGLELESLHEALVASPANTNFLAHDVLPVLSDGDYDDAFPMRMVSKDLALAVDLARDVGMPVELSALVEQVHRRARARFGDEAGEISALRLYEELAGTLFRFRS
jgi:3-hydroxyisobutyrate dehydrogenase